MNKKSTVRRLLICSKGKEMLATLSILKTVLSIQNFVEIKVLNRKNSFF